MVRDNVWTWVEPIELIDTNLRDAQLWVLRNPSVVAEADESRGSVRKKKPLAVQAATDINLNNLGFLYQSMGDHARAAPLHQSAVDSMLGHLENTAYVQSEQQQMLMNQSVRQLLDDYVDCCIEGGLNPQGAVERLTQWKGSILRRGRGLRLAAENHAIANQFGKLQSVAGQISTITQKVPDPNQTDAWRKRLDSLFEQQRKLETELISRSAEFREANKEITFEQIRESIPADGVLVDYLEYNGKEGRSLAASVIRRDGDLALLNLGLVAEIGGAIDKWRESHGMSREGQAAGAKLREKVWKPLLPLIMDANLILVSTDGVLGRLPLAALPGKKPGNYLIEDHRLAMIPVPQLLPDLVAGTDAEASESETLLLVGDVNYDAGKATEPKGSVPDFETLAATREAHGLEWPRLKETGHEVEFIKELFEKTREATEHTVVDLRESMATESAFRFQAPKCQILHLATHGFFATREKKSALSPELIAESQEMMQLGQQQQRFVGFSPGQLSGLVFAGANRTPQSLGMRSDDTESDDGIMTADEISYLPLHCVELAVLSACETGLGEVAGGEGLIGIQRAFQVSGVDSVVATMWKVDDTMTRVLMERFYRNLWERRMSKLDALREAQLAMLKHYDPKTGQLRGLGGKSVKVDITKPTMEIPSDRLNPRYWAAFVLSGDWR